MKGPDGFVSGERILFHFSFLFLLLFSSSFILTLIPPLTGCLSRYGCQECPDAIWPPYSHAGSDLVRFFSLFSFLFSLILFFTIPSFSPILSISLFGSRDLSDFGKDGKLDAVEFAVAMFLVERARSGVPLPAQLPPNVVQSLTGTSSSQQVPSMSGAMAAPAQGDWTVTPQEKATYDVTFRSLDSQQRGVVSGQQAASVFQSSRLSNAVLSQIWFEFSFILLHFNAFTL